MILAGILLAVLSGLCNGLFTTPMKLEPMWKWENIWLVFILIACLVMPMTLVSPVSSFLPDILTQSPRPALVAAVFFGFVWGFGAICFGLSVDSIGVSVANTLVIGLSSALGSLVPLFVASQFHLGAKQVVLFAGVICLLVGVIVCGNAGRGRDRGRPLHSKSAPVGYLLAVAAGVMSAIFNIGYALALPITDTGVRLGLSRFSATNCIWLLMLGAGSIPNIIYCVIVMLRNHSGRILYAPHSLFSWLRSGSMGILWGSSIFLYGAATPRLGRLGPSVGWPLSLAVGLLVANFMGVLLKEWKNAAAPAVTLMRFGVAVLLLAIVLCGISARFPE